MQTIENQIQEWKISEDHPTLTAIKANLVKGLKRIRDNSNFERKMQALHFLSDKVDPQKFQKIPAQEKQTIYSIEAGIKNLLSDTILDSLGNYCVIHNRRGCSLWAAGYLYTKLFLTEGHPGGVFQLEKGIMEDGTVFAFLKVKVKETYFYLYGTDFRKIYAGDELPDQRLRMEIVWRGEDYGFILRYNWNHVLFSVEGLECSYTSPVSGNPEKDIGFSQWSVVPTDEKGIPVPSPQKQQDDIVDLRKVAMESSFEDQEEQQQQQQQQQQQEPHREALNQVVDAIANSVKPIPQAQLRSLDRVIGNSAAHLDVLNTVASSDSDHVTEATRDSAVKEIEQIQQTLVSAVSDINGSGSGESVVTTVLPVLKKQNTQSQKFIQKNKLVEISEEQQETFRAARHLFADSQSQVALSSIDKQQQTKMQKQIEQKRKAQQARLKLEQDEEEEEEEEEEEDLLALFQSQIDQLPTHQEEKTRLKKRAAGYSQDRRKQLFQASHKNGKRAVMKILQQQDTQEAQVQAQKQQQQHRKEDLQVAKAMEIVRKKRQEQQEAAALAAAKEKERKQAQLATAEAEAMVKRMQQQKAEAAAIAQKRRKFAAAAEEAAQNARKKHQQAQAHAAVAEADKRKQQQARIAAQALSHKEKQQAEAAKALEVALQKEKEAIKEAETAEATARQQQKRASEAEKEALQAKKKHEEQIQASKAARDAAAAQQQKAILAAKALQSQEQEKRLQQLKITAQKASLGSAEESIERAKELLRQKNRDGIEEALAGLTGIAIKAAQQVQQSTVAPKGVDSQRVMALTQVSQQASSLAQQLVDILPSSPIKKEAGQLTQQATQKSAQLKVLTQHLHSTQSGKQMLQQLQVAQGMKKTLPTLEAQKTVDKLERTIQTAKREAQTSSTAGDTAHAEALTEIARNATQTVQKISDILQNKGQRASTSTTTTSTTTGIGGFFSNLFGGGGDNNNNNDDNDNTVVSDQDEKQKQEDVWEEKPFPVKDSKYQSMTVRARRLFPSGFPTSTMTKAKIHDSILQLGGEMEDGRTKKENLEYLKGLVYGQIRPPRRIPRRQFQKSAPAKSWDQRMEHYCNVFEDEDINPFNVSGRRTRPPPGGYTHELLASLCEDPRTFCNNRQSSTSHAYKKYCAV